MTDTLHRILPQVQKPARYVGGEYNQIVKDKKNVDVRVAFCFPDTYEIGMSNIGMRILYGLMNEMPGVWCERVFAPWGDMEEQMRAHAIPLYALESHDPVKAFDLIAFTIGYEMSYTNIFNMLELSCVPLLAREREGLENIVFAGGVCAVNPEPLADFIDFFSLGEGEEITKEIIDCYRQAKKDGCTKQEFLLRASKIDGVSTPITKMERLPPSRPKTARPRVSESASCRTWTSRIFRRRRSFPRRKLSMTGRILKFSAAASAAAASVRRASATGRCARKVWTRSISRRSNRSKTPATAK